VNETGGPGKLRLKVIGGNAAGAEIQIEDELLIGRLAEGPGNLAEDIEISRRHARIARTSETEYRIEDLGSTNGTMVNGRKITAPEVLMTGDKIEIGQTTLVVQYSAAFPAAETPRAGTVVPTPEAPPEAPEEPAELPVEEALAEEAPPEPAFPEESPAAEAPIAEAPAEEAPAPEALAEEAPAEPAFPEEAAPEAPGPPPAEEGVPDPFAPIEGAAAEAVAPEVAAAEEASPPPPPLGLRLEVDFEAGEVVLRLDDESEPVRFVHEDGRWRIADGS
jgi:pSer/pThr/pTyr-binding forkhead associated (FHA) protein